MTHIHFHAGFTKVHKLQQYDKDWLGCEAFYTGNREDTCH